jgi:hypothetical protein
MGPSSKRDEPKLATVLACGPGAYGVVRLSQEAKDAFDALCGQADQTSMREAATIKRFFQRFTTHGPHGFDGKQFKSEGRFKDGTGKQVRVFAMKAYQWRLYGVLKHHDGKPAFFGLCVDPSKKKNKADRAILERCARLSSDL